ncbi:MAG: hypothetical protein QXG39_03390 [Candidatus Aenigmatarchaeota archaeon]
MDWYSLRVAKRVEGRITSFSMSTFLELVYFDKRIILNDLNKSHGGSYAIEENPVTTMHGFVVCRNTRYILAISDVKYSSKDCFVASLPSMFVNPLRERLSQIPRFELPEYLYNDKDIMLYFYVPYDFLVKDQSGQRQKRHVCPCVEFPLGVGIGRYFYLPYLKLLRVGKFTFYLNKHYEYFIYEKSEQEFEVIRLNTEIPLAVFGIKELSENRLRCLKKTLESQGIDYDVSVLKDDTYIKIKTKDTN